MSSRDAIVLAEQLGTEPRSRFRAAVLGDPAYLGWTREAELLADIYDALNDNSVVTIKAAGGKARRPEPHVRPTQAADEAEPIQSPSGSIDDFPIHLVMAMTAGKK